MSKTGVWAEVIDDNCGGITLGISEGGTQLGEMDIVVLGHEAHIIGLSPEPEINDGYFLPGCVAVKNCLRDDRHIKIKHLYDIEETEIDLKT